MSGKSDEGVEVHGFRRPLALLAMRSDSTVETSVKCERHNGRKAGFLRFERDQREGAPGLAAVLDAGEGVEVALVGVGEGVEVFLVVWICEWPMRSITDLRSAPPASSQDAWAWRR